MNKWMKWIKELNNLRLLLPACFVAIVLSVTLSGYSAPVYEVHEYEFPDMPQQEKKEKSAMVLPEIEELPEADKSAAEGIGTSGTLSYVDESGVVYQDGTYTGTAMGFGGPITVSVTIKNGKITEISVISAPGETDSYFSSALSVLSRIISGQTTNVDAVSGATYSSNGLIGAVRNALAQAAGKAPEEETETEVPKPEPAAEKEKPVKMVAGAGYRDGGYEGTANGFGGPVTVSVTIRDGKIIAVEIISADKETPEYLEKAKALTGMIVKQQSADLDAIAGATYSSNGIKNAAIKALQQAL